MPTAGLGISRAEAGDATAAKRAQQTLDAAMALIDPVWGGVFQYSEAGSWSHPHFEKIMSSRHNICGNTARL